MSIAESFERVACAVERMADCAERNEKAMASLMGTMAKMIKAQYPTIDICEKHLIVDCEACQELDE